MNDKANCHMLQIVRGKCIYYANNEKPPGRAAKIALLKQDTLGDLWIGNSSDSAEELILSTQMRIGPIALISSLQADFYIIQHRNEKELNFFQTQVRLSKEEIQAIKKGRREDIAAHLTTKSSRKHCQFSIAHDSINWGQYDIVISINSCIPRKTRDKFRSVLWACIPQEGEINDWMLSNLKYDCLFNHNWSDGPRPKGIVLDFPYTFVEIDQFKNISMPKNHASRSGIYLEINSCEPHIRPPRIEGVKQAEDLRRITHHKLKIHRGLIENHLEDLSTSLVLLKLGGRPTRGNSFAEAIASGTPVLLRKEDCFGNLRLPRKSYYTNLRELGTRLQELENPTIWKRLLEDQQRYLMSSGFAYPLEQLSYAYNQKNTFTWKLKKRIHRIHCIKNTMKRFRPRHKLRLITEKASNKIFGH